METWANPWAFFVFLQAIGFGVAIVLHFSTFLTAAGKLFSFWAH